MKIFKLILLAFFISLFVYPSRVQAAKKFTGPKVAVKPRTTGGSIPASVRYRKDKLGIVFSFNNFSGIESVSYSFTYNTNGIPQGAGGTVTASNNPSSPRELLFGTCSTSVCTFHYNISSARLVLTAKYSNGKTVTKGYRIKTYQ